MKRVAISQSNYIPWKGYFDNIALVDEFVFYDDMQYTKRDWRNRNKIKTAHGLKWLTIPVQVKGKYFQKIKDTLIDDREWNTKHLQVLKQQYKKSRCFNGVIPFIEEMFFGATQATISEVNFHFINTICKYLDIDTKLSFSSAYDLSNEDKTGRLVGICEQLGATSYYSGPAAKEYMDVELFGEKGIEVAYYDYSNYQEYEQLHEGFEHGVTILDLLFNEGENARQFLKYTKKQSI